MEPMPPSVLLKEIVASGTYSVGYGRRKSTIMSHINSVQFIEERAWWTGYLFRGI